MAYAKLYDLMAYARLYDLLLLLLQATYYP